LIRASADLIANSEPEGPGATGSLVPAPPGNSALPTRAKTAPLYAVDDQQRPELTALDRPETAIIFN
jgi:hypothetical protein